MTDREAIRAAQAVLYGDGNTTDLVAEALDILEAALAEPEWFPMVDAPKDGTEIRYRITSRVRWGKPGLWNENPYSLIYEWQPIQEPE